MRLIDEMTEDDINYLKDDSKIIIEAIGLEAFKKLVILNNGISLYIPKVESVEICLRNKKILSEFDGKNYRELAKKYGLTETWIRKITEQHGGN